MAEVFAEAAEEVVALEEAPVEAEEAPAPPEAEEPAAPDEEDLGGGPDALAPVSVPEDRLIIKHAEMSLLVQDTNVAIERVTQIAVDNGGYVISSQVWLEEDYKGATITIAVRVDQFEAAMRRLRHIAIEVLGEAASGEDVSAEYVDLESRLRNLEATRDRIRSFLDKARTVEESLEVNRQLAEIEAEIEEVKGRMNYLAGRSAFSTITVNLQPPRPTPTITPTPTATPTPTPTATATVTATPTPWSPQKIAGSALETQGTLMRGLADALIWIVLVLGPYVLVTALIALGIRAIIRRRKGSDQTTEPPP
jgi:hypothetical protein